MTDTNGEQKFELEMQMHRDTHDLIRSLKDDVGEIASRLDSHIADDNKVHAVVNRHTAYWKTFSGGATALMAYLGLTK